MAAAGRESSGSLFCLITVMFVRTLVANGRNPIRTNVGIHWLRRANGQRADNTTVIGAAASGMRVLPGPLSPLPLSAGPSPSLDQPLRVPPHLSARPLLAPIRPASQREKRTFPISPPSSPSIPLLIQVKKKGGGNILIIQAVFTHISIPKSLTSWVRRDDVITAA